MVQRSNGKGQNKERINNNKWKMAFSIGLFAGFFWGVLSLIIYYLQLSDIGPSFYAKPFLNPEYALKWQGHLIGLVFFIIFALVISFVYAALLIKINSPWVGIIYGSGLWLVVFFGLNPLLNLTKPVKQLGLNTNSVMLSLYILIGLFIGYSLSAEFNNQDREN